MRGDVHDLTQFGFDGVRLHTYGPCKNNTKYAELMKATGKNFTIGNVHWLQEDTVFNMSAFSNQFMNVNNQDGHLTCTIIQ